MKIIVCGPIFNETVEGKLIDASPAAGKFLTNLVQGFEKNNFEVTKAVYITYPIVSGEKANIVLEYNKSDIIVFKDKINIVKSVKIFQNALVSRIDKETLVIIYNMNYAYWNLYNKISKKGGNCIFILADHTNSYEEKSIVKKLFSLLNEYEMKKYKKVISLAHNPHVKLNKKGDILTLYGGTNYKLFEDFVLPQNKEKKVIMYAGLLSPITGVDSLIDAIKKNDNEDIEFLISGKGELEQQIKELERNDNRVKFLGFLTNEEYLEWLKYSDILINPRNMKLPQNLNNFPSKILEYLCTGRIIISTRFSGHEAFEKNIIYYDGSIDDLNKNINNTVKNYVNLKRIYFDKNKQLAKKFDWIYQTQKIISFSNNKHIEVKR